MSPATLECRFPLRERLGVAVGGRMMFAVFRPGQGRVVARLPLLPFRVLRELVVAGRMLSVSEHFEARAAGDFAGLVGERFAEVPEPGVLMVHRREGSFGYRRVLRNGSHCSGDLSSIWAAG